MTTDLTPASVEDMLSAYDAAGVDRALICGWWGPSGVLIGNDEVAATVARAPDRFHGVAAVDLSHPAAAVRELKRAVLEPPLLPALRRLGGTRRAGVHPDRSHRPAVPLRARSPHPLPGQR
jgi:predicted TIM-barrel fold metal-dependent hydrolase